MSLDIKKIHCHYGALEAVRGVSMQIEQNSIVGLLGANGSGKSTIMKTISGLMKPTQGEIWLDGQRLDGMSAAGKKAALMQMGFADKSLGFLQTLIGSSEKIREFNDQLLEMGGITKEVADKQLTPFGVPNHTAPSPVAVMLRI